MSIARGSNTSLPSTILSASSIPIPNEDDEDKGPRRTFRLKRDQILVKVSHVNDVLSDLKTEVYDDEEKEECHFVRIVRIGPSIRNKEATVPGALIVCHRRVGQFLEELSEAYGEMYYLITENDIMTYIDL